MTTTMATFEHAGKVEVLYGRSGDRVLDLLDERPHAAIAVACRAGNCGACLVEVLAGEAGVELAASRECETLLMLGSPKGARLGCQLVLTDSHAELRLHTLALRPA